MEIKIAAEIAAIFFYISLTLSTSLIVD